MKTQKYIIEVVQNPAIHNAEWLNNLPCLKTGFLNIFYRFSFKNVLIITKVKGSQARIVLKTPVAIAGVNGLTLLIDPLSIFYQIPFFIF